MRRPLTPHEVSLIRPLIERQRALQERVAELEQGIQTVARAFYGENVPVELEQEGDGTVWIAGPDIPEGAFTLTGYPQE